MTGQVQACMQSWPVQDAKAQFSELLETCLALLSDRGRSEWVLPSRGHARRRTPSAAG